MAPLKKLIQEKVQCLSLKNYRGVACSVLLYFIVGVRYVMSSGLIFRAAGAGGLQRARKELGPGL